jgi:hypothetical protein
MTVRLDGLAASRQTPVVGDLATSLGFDVRLSVGALSGLGVTS